MEMARGYRAKSLNKTRYMQNDWNLDTALVIKLPDTKVMRIMSRSVFLAMVILSLPYIGSIFKGSFLNAVHDDFNFGNLIHSDSLDLLFQDLNSKGLIKTGDNALVVGSQDLEPVIAGSQFLNDNDIALVLEPDLDRIGSITDGTFDFALVSSFSDLKFIDHVLKIGGILAVQLNNDENSSGFKRLSNYKIGYLRRFNSTIVAMRKTGLADELVVSSTKRRRLLQELPLEAKKAALEDIEDVLLEPPRKVLANKLSRKTKLLPELLGDSIESYLCRVFINAGLANEKASMMEWFDQNYPTQNQELEMYNLETVPEKSSGALDVPDWLQKNVKEEEYVVMKVGAEVAEEMIERRAIGLVDEMFLECKNKWEDEEKKIESNKSKRSYWECLALYGRLKDEGVAVHQWWG